MNKTILLFLSSTILLSACAVGPNYRKPTPAVNQNWTALDKNTAIKSNNTVQPDGPWWDQFQDQSLSFLITQALQNNNDWKTAQARIRESRANERAAYAARYPEFSATANATRSKLGASSFGLYDTAAQLGITGDWDIDIAGENRRRDEAARADIQATEAESDNVRLGLLADVARNYILLRTAQRQRDLTVQNLAFQKDTLNITKGQRAEGAISDLEVTRANAQAQSTAARLPQIETSITEAINRLNILTGQNPGTLDAYLSAPAPLPTVPAAWVIATPISAIEKRPDVRAAERHLAEAAALRNAAFAEFFPKITLSGFFGTQTSILYGNGPTWNGGINGILPLLNFGRIRAGVNAADARQNQAYYTYQQTILLALEETENTLVSYSNELKRRATLAEVVTEQEKAATIAREQYKAGVATQLDLLTAENNKLDAENDLALSDSAVAQNLIILYRALGERINPENKIVSNMPINDTVPTVDKSIPASALPEKQSDAISNSATADLILIQ